ncbi:hypothetical protein P879_09860 [Paragonimus westermani]|uniref:Zinc finger protein 395 n=1 Tax=Paragonimus westermani TaxID=34504 RepID=A0A8T0DLB6_9TREM|nr:hypothetical protein P879_09860 [Paragonimus westermani]
MIVRDVHSRSYADQSHRHPSVHRKQRTISDTVTGNTVVYGSSVSTPNSTSYGGRSEIRKCRRIYGIEHRDQWCNQCRWKKACRRFPDLPSGSAAPSKSFNEPRAFSSSLPVNEAQPEVSAQCSGDSFTDVVLTSSLTTSSSAPFAL